MGRHIINVYTALNGIKYTKTMYIHLKLLRFLNVENDGGKREIVYAM